MVKEPDVFENACVYLRIVGLGIPPAFVTAAVTGVFTGAGKSRLTFWANAVGLVLNMALDPLMILAWGWGVAGAAIATVISQGVVCALLVWFVKRHPTRPFERFRVLGKVNWERARQILRWSLPIALESGAFTALAMVVTGMVSEWYGENAVAVQRVGSQIESLSWLVGGGFASAVTAFMGQNFGARKWSRIRRGFRVAMAALVGWEVAVTLLLIFCGRFLFSLFLSEPEGILDMGATYLTILAGCQLFMALEGVSSGTFRGVGKTLPPSVISISSNLIRPLLCWWLAGMMGLDGIWLGVTVSAALRGALMYAWFLFKQRGMPRLDEPLAAAEAAT
jgi:putative MATE family efflux protein